MHPNPANPVYLPKEIKQNIIFVGISKNKNPDLPRLCGLMHIFVARSEEHTSELQSRFDLVCRLLLEKKKKKK